MKFRPFDKKIDEIFGGKNRYKIPNFQRDYSWEKKNYQDFFDDLLMSSKADINENGLSITNEDTDYFFGTLLVVGDETKKNIEKPYVVVDGQQRLTTMTLFLAAILKKIEEVDINYKNNFRSKLVLKTTEEGIDKEYQRLLNQSLDPVLPVNILNVNNNRVDGKGHETQNVSQQWLMESFELLYKMLDKKYLINYLLKKSKRNKKIEITNNNYIKFLDKLGNHLLNSTVIVIYSENEKDANILYRNFNFRGKPLSQSDLIKNEIFYLLDDDTTSTLTLWKEIEKNMYIINEKIDTFFYHYMFGKYTEVNYQNLFYHFTKRIKSTGEEYKKFIIKLTKYSNYYRTIVKPENEQTLFEIEKYFLRNDHSKIKRYLEFLNDIEVIQPRILLLSLFNAMEDGRIRSDQFKKIIEMIVYYQSLQVLAKSPTNQLTDMYAKYSRRIEELGKNEKREKIDDIIKKIAFELRNKRIPNKENVLEKGKLFYSKKVIKKEKPKMKKNKSLIKQILYTLSFKEQKHNQKSNDALKFIYDSTLEHIIDEENNFENINSLGNLLLLEQQYHGNDKGILNKQKMYKKSQIILTKNFFESYPEFQKEEKKEEYKKYIEKVVENRRKKLLSDYYDYVIQFFDNF
jgi:hypothetical protein